MKKYLFTLIVFSLMAGASCQEKINIDKEKEAIKAVIENETNSNYAKNFDQQKKSFLQDESLIGISAGKGGYTYMKGWDKISSNYEENHKNSPSPSTDKLEFKNYNIKVYPESAWAVYEQIRYNSEGDFVNNNLQTRVLEKINGEWKIVYLSYIFTTSYEEESEGEDE